MTSEIRGWLAALFAGAIAISGGCSPATPPSGTTATAESPTAVHPDQWPAVKWPFAVDAALDAQVQELLKTMTIEEKIGQIVQGDINSLTPEDVRKYHLGSVLAGGGSSPGKNEFAPAAEWLALADAFYAASVDKSDGGVGIPAIWGIDAMHGHSNIVGATLFPHNVGLGAMRDPDLIQRIGEITAIEVRVTGIDWTFAPTVTVPQDDRWGRTYEGYSESPDVVASYAGRMVIGLQGAPGKSDFLDGSHVLSSAKHFLGDGGTHDGRDQGDAQVSEGELRTVHAAGYRQAVAAGVQTVMASYSSWNGLKMHGAHDLLTDVLKGRMDFQGFVVGDWNGHGQVPGCSNENCPQAFNAGLDMFMAPDGWRGLYQNLLDQARSGAITTSRLDEAVARILRVKMRAHVFEEGPPSKRPNAGKYELLGSADHRAVARQAVRESLVLLKNNGGLLPLNPGKRLLVAGDGADNISKQCGGWTITWQGTGLTNQQFPGATSIWKGIQTAVKAAGGHAELSVDGKYKAKPDVAVVVFGEDPYAEFQGDRKVLSLPGTATQHLEMMRRFKDAGIPVVAVFLSGRPLWVNRELNLSSAFVAAWLPGSEGAGIADVLVRKSDGSVANDFRGQLAYSWPRSAAGAPLNVGQANYDPLFPFGFGLTYAKGQELAELPEDSGVSAELMSTGLYLDHGDPVQPWSIQVTDGAQDITRITTLPATAVGGRVEVSAAKDDDGTARRYVWKGGGTAVVEVSGVTSADVSREANGDVLLLIRLKRDGKASAPVTATMRCGSKCAGTIPFDAALASIPNGKWQTIGVPLKCFQRAGADVAKIDAPLAISTTGTLDLSLSHLALGTVADQVAACP